MALVGPECDKAVYGQVTMAFPGGNIIQEAPEPIAAALALVAANPPGGVAVAISIRVLGADGLSVECCPEGFYFDGDARTCKLGAPAPTPPPPTPPPPTPPPPAPPDPGDDDLNTNFSTLFQILITLINTVQPLIGPPKPPGEIDACCKSFLVVLSNMLRQLTRIANVISTPPPGGSPPIDISIVVTELTCICEQLTALAGASSAIPSSLDTGLKSISDAIANQKPTDTTALVEQLKLLVREGDVKQPILDYLTTQGFMSSNDAQVLAGSDWGDAIVTVFRTYAWNALQWVLKTAGLNWDGVKWVANDLGNSLASIVSAIASTALTAGAAPLYPEIKGLVDAVVAVLIPTSPPTIGEVNVDPDLIISKTLAPALIMNGVMLVASYFGWDVNESLREYVDVASEFIGLQEVRELKVGSLMRFGPMRVAEMNARRVYRQELPGAGALATLAGRGLITTDRYGQIAPLTGVPTELQGPTLEAGQSGLNARMMLRLVGTGLFSDADVVDELTFAGMRQTSQHRLVLAAAYLGTEPERGKLRSALEAMYRAGMISDNDFVSRLESAEHNTNRTNLLLETVQLEKQIVLAKENESAYSREFLAGLLDAPGYQMALEGLGMQPPDVAARLFRDETHVNVTTSIQAAREARALQRAQAAAERKTAIEAYRAGSLNEATLAAALLATGLTPTQVAAMTSYQVLQSAGVLRWIYGQRLPPSQAILLRQRVSDLTRQREIGMLSDSQYVSALTALGIPANYINALRAGANAHVSPKTAAILTPVSTT